MRGEPSKRDLLRIDGKVIYVLDVKVCEWVGIKTSASMVFHVSKDRASNDSSHASRNLWKALLFGRSTPNTSAITYFHVNVPE